MSTKKFSFRQMINNDFNLTLAVLIPLFFWGIYLLAVIIAGGSPVLMYLAFAITIASHYFLWRRMRKIRGIIEAGEIISGEIVKVLFDGERGRVQYSYTYLGEKYLGTTAIFSNNLTRSFTNGQAIDMVIHQDHPDRAYLLDLYAK